MPKGTDTMFFIPHTDLPKGRKATYLRIVAARKPNKAEEMRIRFTCGGDRIEYDGNVSTPGADLTTVKCLLNSVISTVDARFMAMDIKDFYLNNPMERYKYLAFLHTTFCKTFLHTLCHISYLFLHTT